MVPGGPRSPGSPGGPLTPGSPVEPVSPAFYTARLYFTEQSLPKQLWKIFFFSLAQLRKNVIMVVPQLRRCMSELYSSNLFLNEQTWLNYYLLKVPLYVLSLLSLPCNLMELTIHLIALHGHIIPFTLEIWCSPHFIPLQSWHLINVSSYFLLPLLWSSFFTCNSFRSLWSSRALWSSLSLFTFNQEKQEPSKSKSFFLTYNNFWYERL